MSNVTGKMLACCAFFGAMLLGGWMTVNAAGDATGTEIVMLRHLGSISGMVGFWFGYWLYGQ